MSSHSFTNFVPTSQNVAPGVIDASKIKGGTDYWRARFADTGDYSVVDTNTGATTYADALRSIKTSTGAQANSKASTYMNTRWDFSLNATVDFSYYYTGGDGNTQCFIGLADAADGWTGSAVFGLISNAWRLYTSDGSATNSSTWSLNTSTWYVFRLAFTPTSVSAYTSTDDGKNFTLRATNTTHVPTSGRASPCFWVFNGATAADVSAYVRDFKITVA